MKRAFHHIQTITAFSTVFSKRAYIMFLMYCLLLPINYKKTRHKNTRRKNVKSKIKYLALVGLVILFNPQKYLISV